MNEPWRRRLASWNRALALAGGILVVGGLVALLIRQQAFLPGEIALAVGVLLLLAAWWVDPAAVRQILTSRTARYGGVLALMSLALLGILVLLNVISYRHYARWDLTEEGLFTLSPQTRAVLDQVTQPVRITGFFYQDQQIDERQVRERLASYAAYNHLISYDIVDPEAQPSLASRYGISGGVYALVVEAGERRQDVYTVDEQAITSAVLRVTLDREVTVYFLTGHGEKDLDGGGMAGYKEMSALLESSGYRVEPLLLSTYRGVLPVTDTVVLLAGPRAPLSAGEEQHLAEYLRRGGRLLLLLDPSPSPELSALLLPWGVQPLDSRIVDYEYAWNNDPESPLIEGANPNHTISKNLSEMLLAGARPLAASLEAVEGLTHVPLLISGPSSWGETDPGQDPPEYDDGQDQRGPLALAVYVQGRLPGSTPAADARIVIVGDSDFCANAYFYGGNRQFFFNAVNWLAGEESLARIDAAQPRQRQVILNTIQRRAILYLTLVGLPLLVVGVGVGVWLRRRKG